MLGMRATDITRRRRERTRRANRPGQRLLRAATYSGLLVLLALLILPTAALALSAGLFRSLTHDLPDVGQLEALPFQYRSSTAVTRLYAWDRPDDEGLRRAVVIDEISDPRALSAGWISAETLPPPVLAALAAGFGDSPPPDPPSLVEVLTAWRLTGAIPAPESGLTANLIRTHLRQGQGAQPGDARRAWQDWYLSVQLDRRYAREEQLEWALNTAYYGNLAFGLEAAARVYFGKGAAELTTGEAAMLAAVAGNPTANPFDDPAAARRGQADMLAALVAGGTLSAQDAESARATPPALAPPPGSRSAAPDFARLARRELEDILGPARLLSGDLLVETTLDLALQEQVACVTAAYSGRDNGSGGGPACPALAIRPGDSGTPAGGELSTAVVALNPNTGEVEALAGSMEADSARPIGTLAQPLIYLTALSRGHTAATLTMDVPAIYLQDGRPYAPRNSDGLFRGPLRLREALASGRSVPALQVFGWVGAARVLETARALGLEPPADSADLDFAFPEQGFPATLLDLSRAFAAASNEGVIAGFANGEDLPRPATIRTIIDGEGDEIYAYQPATRETLSPELAYLLTDMLKETEQRCPAGDCAQQDNLPGDRPEAVALGESTEGDSLDIGFTPDQLIAVRTSGEAADPAIATQIRQDLLTWATADLPATDWTRPASLRSVEVCAISGLLPSRAADCPTVSEWFVPGTEPSEVDEMVREIAINRETGRRATVFTPPHLIEQRTYIAYPPEAAGWAEDAGIEPPPVEYDTIRRVPTRAGGAELNVEPWSVVSGQWSISGSAGGDDFAYYRLAAFPGLLPEAMQTLVERGETPIEASELGVWDTTLFEDGLYTLLLTVVRRDGTFDEVAIPVAISNKDR